MKGDGDTSISACRCREPWTSPLIVWPMRCSATRRVLPRSRSRCSVLSCGSSSSARIAVAGGDLQPTLDELPLSMRTVTECPVGSVLRFGGRRSGARAYVAVDGGFAVPPVLGSRSTHVSSAMGGIQGRALKAGDRIPLNAATSGIRTRVRPGSRATVTGGARVRVLPGPQVEYFDPPALDALQRTRYTISPQSDRMGYRLNGGSPEVFRAKGEMISDATVVGGVQVPPSGQPILLMADRQTTGGYPQIAVVITADLPLAAQLAPADWIEFELCSRADAMAALAAQEQHPMAADDRSIRPRSSVPLSTFTTLGIGGPARWFVRATTAEDVAAAHQWCGLQELPLFVLGGGSNLVIADTGFDGLVLQIAIRGIEFAPHRSPTLVRVGAGEPWDDVVASTVSRGLAGLECLSGIPGSAGGTPIQNVGAYGQEVSDTLTEVTVFDRTNGCMATLTGADCRFGYRTSRFKREDAGRFVVCGMQFRAAAWIADGHLPGRHQSPAEPFDSVARAHGCPQGRARHPPAKGDGHRRTGPGHAERRIVFHEPRGRLRRACAARIPVGRARSRISHAARSDEGAGCVADRAGRISAGTCMRTGRACRPSIRWRSSIVAAPRHATCSAWRPRSSAGSPIDSASARAGARVRRFHRRSRGLVPQGRAQLDEIHEDTTACRHC